MRTRFGLILALPLAFAAGMALGQAKPRMWADVVLDQTTDQIPRRTRLHVNIDHWDPGAETGKHTHPGPTIIVVLDGELTETAKGRTNILSAGHGYWRPADEEHNVRNAGSQPARALAVHMDPAAR